MNYIHPFYTDLTRFNREYRVVDLPWDPPYLWMLGIKIHNAFSEHAENVRREQEAFVSKMERLGISRLSRMTTGEIFDLCAR